MMLSKIHDKSFFITGMEDENSSLCCIKRDVFCCEGNIQQRHSSHGEQYTPLHAESVNVRIVK